MPHFLFPFCSAQDLGPYMAETFGSAYLDSSTPRVCLTTPGAQRTGRRAVEQGHEIQVELLCYGATRLGLDVLGDRSIAARGFPSVQSVRGIDNDLLGQASNTRKCLQGSDRCLKSKPIVRLSGPCVYPALAGFRASGGARAVGRNGRGGLWSATSQPAAARPSPCRRVYLRPSDR